MSVQPARSLRSRLTTVLGSRWGLVLTGVTIGVLAPILSKLGNPPNSGFCTLRYVGGLAQALFPTGAVEGCFCSFQSDFGTQTVPRADFLSPELPGFVLGAFVAALAFGEFRARLGLGAVIQFLLGLCGMMGIIAFWGCPLRLLLRLGGGDLSALAGLAGLLAGIAAGVWFLRSGFDAGGSRPVHWATGLLLPLAMVGLLVWMMVGQTELPVPRPPLLFALVAGLVVGLLAQRSRFCIMSSFRNVALMRSLRPLAAVGSVVIAALITNWLLGQLNWGFAGQPFSHSDYLWGFLGMLLGGLAFTLAGACPTRQLFLSGEGNLNAGSFVLGMLAGAIVAQRAAIYVTRDIVIAGNVIVVGPSTAARIAVIAALVLCLAIGVLRIINWRPLRLRARI